MIDVKKSKKGVLPYSEKYFYDKPKLIDALKIVDYNATRNLKNYSGFKRLKIFTKIIDLSMKPDELLDQFRKNTKYEVRRAERDGVTFELENDLDAFLFFYNEFAKSKKNYKEVPLLKRNDINCLKGNIVVTKAVYEGKVLVMHSYLIDSIIKRTRLLSTSSLFRDETDKKQKGLIGRANRFLHFHDMVYFQNQGFRDYDMGGFAHNSNDEEREKIAAFKSSFGGELVEESAYTSFPLYVCREIINLVSMVKSKLS